MNYVATITVHDDTGGVGTNGPCFRAIAVNLLGDGYGGTGVTPLEAVAEVFRHMRKLSEAERRLEAQQKGHKVIP